MGYRFRIILAAVLSLHAFLYSQSLDTLLEEAGASDKAMDTKGALALYLEAEKLAPENVDVLLGIAKQYGESMLDAPNTAGKRKAGETAVAYCRKALKISPNHSGAHLSIAICYGRLTDFVKAKQRVEYSRLIKEHADKALTLDPKSDYAWHMLGRWHRGIAEIDPFTRGIAKLVYGGIPKGSNREAIEAFRKAISLNPNRLIHRIELGIALCAAGKTTEGRTEIEKALAMPIRERDDPENKRRGKIVLSKGK